MQYLPEFLTVAFINFLGVLSPGPSFVLTTRNGLKYSRRTAIHTALGLGLGVAVMIGFSIIGAQFVTKSAKIFEALRLIGAGYLIYLGYRSLTDKLHSIKAASQATTYDPTPRAAIGMGFITNATNPKGLIFFMSLFTVIVSRTTPLGIKALYGLEMSLMEFTWFAILGTIISNKAIKNRIGRLQYIVERVMGTVLILLGIKIALFP